MASTWDSPDIDEINGIQELGIVTENFDAIGLCCKRKFGYDIARLGTLD
jgi:hypothetical protein